MTNKQLFNEDTKLSRRMQGKRAIATLNSCKLELKNELKKLFIVFDRALKRVDSTVNQYPVESRSRAFDANVMQTAFMSELIKEFRDKAFFGKYRRIILREKGYIILFKKLNNNGMPMNTITLNIQNILNQNQTLDLFANTDYNDEPILYFGYKKNRQGQFFEPQLVYIDDGVIRFNITEKDVQNTNLVNLKQKSIKRNVVPKLKNTINKIKRA